MQIDSLSILSFIICWVMGGMISLHLSKDETIESEKLAHIINGILFGYIIILGILTFWLSSKISNLLLYFKK